MSAEYRAQRQENPGYSLKYTDSVDKEFGGHLGEFWVYLDGDLKHIAVLLFFCLTYIRNIMITVPIQHNSSSTFIRQTFKGSNGSRCSTLALSLVSECAVLIDSVFV